MLRQTLSDPGARRAYVATKVGVFVVAALATVPLARLVGPRAWTGLVVFGLVLAVLTAAVLAASRSSRPVADKDEICNETEDPEQPALPRARSSSER